MRDSLWWMDLPTTCTYLILMVVTILTSGPRFARMNMEIVDWCQFCLVWLFAMYIVMFWVCFRWQTDLVGGLKEIFRQHYCSILFSLAITHVCVCAVIQVLYKARFISKHIFNLYKYIY